MVIVLPFECGDPLSCSVPLVPCCVPGGSTVCCVPGGSTVCCVPGGSTVCCEAGESTVTETRRVDSSPLESVTVSVPVCVPVDVNGIDTTGPEAWAPLSN